MKEWLITNKIYILFLAFALIKGVIWILIIPPFLFPDEPAHFAYTQYIVEEKNLPKNDGKLSPHLLSKSEELEEAINLIKNDYKIWSMDPINLKIGESPNIPENFPSYSRKVNAENYKNAAAVYPPLYYAFEAIPYVIGYNLDIFHRVYLMRFFSLIFLLITLIFAHKIAFFISNDKVFSFTVAAVISLIPALNIISFGTINNDAALIALGQIMFYYLIRLLHSRNITAKEIIKGGALLGAVLLTKTQAVFFVPLTMGVFIYNGVKYGKLPHKLTGLIILFLTAGIAALPFFAPPILAYFSGSSEEIFYSLRNENFKMEQNALILLANDIVRRMAVFNTFWAEFLHTFASFRLYGEIAAGLLSVFALLGLTFAFVKFKGKELNHWLLFCLLSILPLEFLYTLLYFKNALINNYYQFPGQGRYYYILITPIIILFVFGLQNFFSLLKIPPRFIYAGLLFLFLLFHNLAFINLAPY
ncbi:MAG: hypothetical protein US76_01070 [Parcubacteria group bacterium GW2011_GWA2_38_13b]|nr:MAG: hypothetical protein US76_01070 [Parcubacteria group bacterium GW2011_GWA2_38_13b]